MSYVSMEGPVGRAYREGYAVPAFCTWNAETIEVVLRVAERMRAPVILMHGPSEFTVLPPALMASVARAVGERYDVPAVLHLDHGDTPAVVEECLACGYTSVMLDYSMRPFEENIAALERVGRLAHARGVSVEGELGKVGKADELTAEGGDRLALTDPGEAAEYVRCTGVDLLAVSVGNKHGFYQGEPHREFGLLEELHSAVGVPLVMHGGTGIPEKDIRRSITQGIAKVNVASELVHGLRGSLTSQWANGRNLWTPLAMAEAVHGLEASVERWIRMTGAEGKA
jgi:tagatose 1,6-diphosphate aldolase GatY/KbaY